MKPDIKKRWIAALRSGEYKQTYNTLRKDDCFCAQGVLCDLYAKEKNKEWELKIGRYDKYSILGIMYSIPADIHDWADLPMDTTSTQSEAYVIAHLNDREYKTFEEIAEYIEKNF